MNSIDSTGGTSMTDNIKDMDDEVGQPENQQQQKSWQRSIKPLNNYYKLNVDGPISGSSLGYGGVIIDSNGTLSMAFVGPVHKGDLNYAVISAILMAFGYTPELHHMIVNAVEVNVASGGINEGVAVGGPMENSFPTVNPIGWV
ncbi:hypothetical protein MA16_Dca020957 [Dendrobium catenatum]|uniref:RNase H type-1 domain-containing protein n=1 Tax=Dendrobium catenatum TaxID=906689 RepID=A0A2I0VFQ3_9ASPA|nr:hypothetical protein MA16_Dca020957 [Dendrobium catenatum]